MLVVVVGTASAIGGIRAFFLDKGFIGLPPQGATPSTPESGGLEIFYWLGYPWANLGRSRACVYGDGRLLWLRGGAEPDAPPGHDSDPAWAPGRKIAFATKREGNFEIYVMNADGSGQRNLTHNPAVDRFPVWSPERKPGG